MKYTDLHVHSHYCDGESSIEELILSAIEKNMECIGISGHGYTSFDSSYCIPIERYDEYISEINGLKEKYKDKITVLCGIEQDLYSDGPTDRFDYVIGSLHYFKTDKGYVPIDSSTEAWETALKECFDGDCVKLYESYFDAVAEIPEKVKPDIIGHFNLISKFNEGFRYFDENDPRFIAAYKKALDKMLPYGIPFELNTGAISRGYRTFPYPSEPMIEYILEKGGKIIFSSDSHSPKNLCFQFDKWKEYFGKRGIEINNFDIKDI